MALTRLEKVKFSLVRCMNRIIKIDLYGIRILGIQVTPKEVADQLNYPRLDFSEAQYKFNRIFRVKSFYVFIPK